MDKKQEILELRAQGMSYQKIGDALGVDKSYAFRVCSGKEKRFPRKRLHDVLPGLSEEEIARRYGSVETGCVSEVLVAARLLTLGFDVWRPFIDRHRCDLAVLVNNRLLRIQVKTASYCKVGKRFRGALTTKKHGLHCRYRDGELDFFIVKCSGCEEYYVIPAAVGNRVTSVNLYPNRERLLEKNEGFEEYRNRFDLLQE